MPSARVAARQLISITTARLTEIMLIGNIATRVREKLSYDFRTGKFANNDKANAMLKREPRKGWEFGYV